VFNIYINFKQVVVNNYVGIRARIASKAL